MSEPASISTGIANRYATAVFDIARDEKNLDALDKDVDALDAALKDSAELRDAISSPLYSRAALKDAMLALGPKMGLTATMTNTLGLLADKRRLFVLPALVRALREKLAAERGEVTADVISAKALTKTQSDKLAKTLKDKLGSDVKINATVDESLIGGLIVTVGSKMIDTSIRSKLAALQNTMKEAR